jgi:hypothetical protein
MNLEFFILFLTTPKQFVFPDARISQTNPYKLRYKKRNLKIQTDVCIWWNFQLFVTTNS